MVFTDPIRGFRGLNTSQDFRHLSPNFITFSQNMEWLSETDLYTRRGSSIRKDNVQWGSNAKVIDGIDFKRRVDDFFYEIVFLSDGRIFYIESNNANFENATGSHYTEILASDDSTSPALVNPLPKVSFDSIDSVLYIVDGSSNIYSWDTTTTGLRLVADPTDFVLDFTIADGIDATLDAVYEDAADTSRKFLVTVTKVNGDGDLKLSTRQTAGNTRPGTTGTLNKVSGTGDASIAFTGITFSETFEEYKLYQRRGFAVSNEGIINVTSSRNGAGFNLAGAGFLEFDVIEGLKVSNFLPFKRGAIITTEDKVTEKFNLHTLTGFKFFDPSVAGTDTGQFKAERESKVHGIVGRSGQEIGNVVVGLTPNGFISFGGEISTEFGITDQQTLSDPIKDQIEKINFNASDQIFSVVDTVNQRYICAVPVFDFPDASTLFVYDYGKSADGFPRWSIWNLSYDGISALFKIKNKIYVADLSGNYYELTKDKVFTDNNSTYASRIETADLGGGINAVEKQFKNVMIDFKVPATEQEVTLFAKLDGKTIRNSATGRKLKKIKLTPEESDDGIISDSTFIDNDTLIGQSKTGFAFVRDSIIAGTGRAAQLGILGNGLGINWGITQMMVELEPRGKSRGR